MNESLKPVICSLALLAAQSVLAQPAPLFFRLLSQTNSIITAFDAHGMLVWTNSASEGITCTVQRASTLTGPDTWVDYLQHAATNACVALRLFDLAPPAGMTLIPAGCFQMGDALMDNPENGEEPVHAVHVSAFYMDKTEVTWAMWCMVREWAVTNGYDLADVGKGKADNHPVCEVDWYDCIKWCNARSQMQGRVPCYTREEDTYKIGEPDDILCNAAADGYRLPTEAEWEKAARGGRSGLRFAWGEAISHAAANYVASPTAYAYDTNSYDGNHTSFSKAGEPYTSPVGYFTQNGYGLYDMAGNVCEWCWDWFDDTYYAGSPASDPSGPDAVIYHSLRGGSWSYDSDSCRSASRGYDDPTFRDGNFGFRTVLHPGP